MPWNPNDADRFKKGLSPSSKRRWAEVANEVLKKTGSESSAIKAANGVTRDAVARKLKKSQSGVGGFK